MEVKLRDGTRIDRRSSMSSRAALRSQAKLASVGGDQEQQFEQSFASLAYAHVSDRAPALLDYLVGFQLVDRNDDNTKAVGIFGFKIGKSWVYAPVFFVNGDLKGHELLYLKNQDSFVPMKENWVNYIINRRPHILGEGVPGEAHQLGALQPDIRSLSQPPVTGKFAALRRPIIKSWAKQADLQGFVARASTVSPRQKHAGLQDRLNLRSFLSQDYQLVKLALAAGQAYPMLKEAMQYWYGPNLLRDCLLDCKAQLEKAAKPDIISGGLADGLFPGSDEQKLKGRKVEMEHTGNPAIAGEIAADHLAEDSRYYDHLEEMEDKAGGILAAVLPRAKQAAGKPPDIEIITDELITENLPEMTESERQKLLQQGYLIKDHRSGEEVSIAYNTQIEMDLMNPDQTGRFEVLTRDGKFEDCLVVCNPHGETGRKNFVTLVKLSPGDEDGKRKACDNYQKSRVFVRIHPQTVKSETSEYRAWFNELTENKSLEVDGSYVALTQRGDGTCEFRIEKDLGDGCYEVSWRDYCRGSCDYQSGGPVCGSYYEPHRPFTAHTSYPQLACRHIRLNSRKGSSIKAYGDTLHLPPEIRVIRTKSPEKCRGCDCVRDDCVCEYFNPRSDEANPIIQPGDLASLQMQIMQKSASSILAREAGKPAGGGLFPLKIWADHDDVVINSNRFSKLAGLISLVKSFGLREKAARQLIKDAELGRQNRYWIKLAQPYRGHLGPYAAGEGMGVPMDTSANYTTDASYGNATVQDYDPGRFQTVPSMMSSMSDQSVYDPMSNMDPRAMQVAQKAFQQNQKEIFDTTMISSMLRAVRKDSLVDRYLSDLTKALSSLGKILFHFYWRSEAFADRYGEQDMPELEDTVRNAFEGLGDLVLFLKQKTVEPLTFGEPALDDAAHT